MSHIICNCGYNVFPTIHKAVGKIKRLAKARPDRLYVPTCCEPGRYHVVCIGQRQGSNLRNRISTPKSRPPAKRCVCGRPTFSTKPEANKKLIIFNERYGAGIYHIVYCDHPLAIGAFHVVKIGSINAKD